MLNHARDSISVASLAMVSKAMWGVSPLGWITQPEITLIDEALNDYEVVWAAAGHPHGVFPTRYSELLTCTKATSMIVGQ